MHSIHGTGFAEWRGPAALALLVTALLALAGCGGEESQPEGEATPSSAEVAEEPSGEEEARSEEASQPFLPVAMRRSTRVETFAHDAHAEIECTVCHEEPEGHGVHRDLVCAECHRSGASMTREELTPLDCLSCHHGAQQARSCESCHDPVEARLVARSLDLGVWTSPRTRELPFDHRVHESAACESCHVEEPTLEPSVSCGSCHEEHHTEEARCMTCHAEPPVSAHDLEAHLDCGGAGCHTAPLVEALAQTRSGCLVCHQDQEAHEPGQECADCHRVRPAGRSDP